MLDIAVEPDNCGLAVGDRRVRQNRERLADQKIAQLLPERHDFANVVARYVFFRPFPWA